MPKLYSFSTVLFICKCGCGDIYSDAELLQYDKVEGVDIEVHCRVVVRYTANPKSAKFACQKLADQLLDLEVDSDAALPVFNNFIAHVTSNMPD